MEIDKARKVAVRQESSVGSPTSSPAVAKPDHLDPSSQGAQQAARPLGAGLQPPSSAETLPSPDAGLHPAEVWRRRLRAHDAPDLPPLSADEEREAGELARRFDPNIKSEGWQERYGGAGTAGPYALGYWRAALRAARSLKSDRFPSLEHTLLGLGRERHALAVQANNPFAPQFGLYMNPRDPRQSYRGELQTTINEKYLRLTGVRDFVSCLERNDVAQYGDALTSWPMGSQRVFTFQEPMRNGHFMALSSIGPLFTSREQDSMGWIHAKLTLKSLAHLEQLFKEALGPSLLGMSAALRLSDVCERVGKLHYFLSHFCFFERGSAGVSDMLATALMHHHGYHHAGWKPGYSADVVALITPSSAAFVEKYQSLMAGPIPHTHA